MATHSSILGWRIPGTEEPSGLPSMGSQSQVRPETEALRGGGRHLEPPSQLPPSQVFQGMGGERWGGCFPPGVGKGCGAPAAKLDRQTWDGRPPLAGRCAGV